MKKLSLVSIIGARPQFIKVAPLCRFLKKINNHYSGMEIKHTIIHTGQHYDYLMNKIFFDQLSIPDPDISLNVGSGSHGWQTGTILQKLEEPLLKENPDWVIVYGDTNSTLAGALVASKMRIPIAHMESGLRSYNRIMPEETNRILTDHCSDILFCPTENAIINLRKEGFNHFINDGKLFPSEKKPLLPSKSRVPSCVNVGDIMYDAVLHGIRIAEKQCSLLTELEIDINNYYLATLHRAENTDQKSRLKSILNAFNDIGKNSTLLFPVHPRTRKMIDSFRLDKNITCHIKMIDPVSYFDMLFLLKNASKLLTDSGGMQKEAFFLGTPCITLRDETEWIETLENGMNRIVGADKEKIVYETLKPYNKNDTLSDQSLFGDGHSAERILAVLHSLKDNLPSENPENKTY